MVFENALNRAGMAAQKAPPMIPPSAMARISRKPLVSAGRIRVTPVAKTAPMMIWPSAPMFQNFMLNAMEMASEVIR